MDFLRTRRRLIFAWLGVFAVLAVSLAPARVAPGFPDDEGLLLVYPEQVLNGAVPNRDYESFYGPGNDWALAAAYAVLGPQVAVERAAGFVYRALIVTAVFALAATDGAVAATVAGLFAATMLIPLGLFASAWLGGQPWRCRACGHASTRSDPEIRSAADGWPAQERSLEVRSSSGLI